jgi:hypothetical protein
MRGNVTCFANLPILLLMKKLTLLGALATLDELEKAAQELKIFSKRG